MDPPRHDVQGATVSPVVAPTNLAKLESTIRQRAANILDSLPRNEEFNWVDQVSIELTTQMLATLFDFPFEDRRKLTHWSDVATAAPGAGIVDSQEQRREELMECLACFTELWNQRVDAEPGNDLISMLAHGEDTRHDDFRWKLRWLVLPVFSYVGGGVRIKLYGALDLVLEADSHRDLQQPIAGLHQVFNDLLVHHLDHDFIVPVGSGAIKQYSLTVHRRLPDGKLRASYPDNTADREPDL